MKMKAGVYERYGSPEVGRPAEVERPAPGENEVLIRVHATSVGAGDRRALCQRPPYVRRHHHRRYGSLRELAETGELRPVIDRSYGLKDIVEAHRNLEQGHKKGNVSVTI